MSLIEQAAQRLRELQAAGADIADPLADSVDVVEKDTAPAPERGVRIPST